MGAWGDDDNGNTSGAAYVFKRNGTTWSQQAKLAASDGAAGDTFGIHVSVSEDTAIVGSAQNDYVGGSDNWGEVTKLTDTDAAVGDAFGISVSVRGSTVVVGASIKDDAAVLSGAAYVFACPRPICLSVRAPPQT